MITEKEIAERKFVFSEPENGASYRVNANEMQRFEKNNDLYLDVYHLIDTYATEHKIRSKYFGLEEICQISETTLKKSVAGTKKITRTFLYKLTVGLHLSVEQANSYFEKCGGALCDDNLEDYICKRALEDGDDICDFIDQFNEYTQKYNKHQIKNKLKKLTD